MLDGPDVYLKIKDLRYVRRTMPEVITRRESDEGQECTFVYDDLQKKLYKFKGNARTIWDMLDGESTIEMITEKLAEAAPDERIVIVKDVCKTIASAGRKGLIKAAIRKNDGLPCGFEAR
ncbi:MAG: PqqD family protein [Syntrophobacteraceae bacterium]